MEKAKRCLPLIIFLVAFAYYAGLSAKEYTWIFVSGDSGDWLAASTWWMVPQPMGSPLYIMLGHFLNLFPGDLVIKMTILLSCLPAAVTVALVYLIVRRLTGRIGIALVSSGVTMGAAVLLTQSTVLEEYALPVMLVTLAYWFWLGERKRTTALCLGLAMAVHVVVGLIALAWLLVERRRWREYKQAMLVFLAIGVAPYSLILALMASEAPPLIAGHLNFASVLTYWGGASGTTVGTMSVFDFPRRLAMVSGILLVCLGLAVVPLAHAFRRDMGRPVWILAATVIVILWFHLTSVDPVTWTFLSFAVPPLAILAGVGLSRLEMRHLRVVALGAVVLILANGVFLNAHALSHQYQDATEFKAEVEAMPEGSAVVVYRGHYSLGLYYSMSLGRDDLVPIVFLAAEAGFGDYLDWLGDEHGVVGETTLELTQAALAQGRTVYIAGSDRNFENLSEDDWREFLSCLSIQGDGSVREIAGSFGSSGLR